MDTLEARAGKASKATQGSSIPGLDFILDFFVGNTNDLNLSRMAEFYEKNTNLAGELSQSSWHTTTGQSPSVSFESYYSNETLAEDKFSHPTLAAYKCAHLD